jgi:hypothetical protein
LGSHALEKVRFKPPARPITFGDWKRLLVVLTFGVAGSGSGFKTMSAPELYGGIVSFVVGLPFILFPKAIGTGFARIGKTIWKRHEEQRGDDLISTMRHKMRQSFPQILPNPDDEAEVIKAFR